MKKETESISCYIIRVIVLYNTSSSIQVFAMRSMSTALLAAAFSLLFLLASQIVTHAASSPVPVPSPANRHATVLPEITVTATVAEDSSSMLVDFATRPVYWLPGTSVFNTQAWRMPYYSFEALPATRRDF